MERLNKKGLWEDFPIVIIYWIANGPIADLSGFKRCPYFS